MSTLRTIGDFPRNEAGYVDRFIGTAYDTVKQVADNLEAVVKVPDALDDINAAQKDVDAKATQVSSDTAEVANNLALVKTAASAAMAASKLYPNTQTGLNNTNDGEYFVIPGPNNGEVFSTLYLNNAGNPEIINTYPSTSGAWDRTNHTGVQAISSIDGLSEELTSLGNSIVKTVNSFGAIGDGKTDDSVAITNAINAGVFTTCENYTYLITDPTLLLKVKDLVGYGYIKYANNIFPASFAKTSFTVNVPTTFSTLNDAVSYMESIDFAADCYGTIQVANGTYNVNSMNPNFKMGDRVIIQGDMSGANPTNCTLIANLAGNGFSLFYINNGNKLGLIQGFNIKGNGRNSDGTWIANSNGSGVTAIAGAYVGIGPNMYFDSCYYGLSASFNGTIDCKSPVTITNAGDAGFFASQNGSIAAPNCIATYCNDAANNLGFGFCAETGGSIDCSGASASHNAQAGFYTLTNGKMWAHGTTSNNNLYGYLAIEGGSLEANPSFTTPVKYSAAYNNTSHGFFANLKSYINANGASSNNNGGNGFFANDASVINVDGIVCTDNGSEGLLGASGSAFDGTTMTIQSNKGAGIKLIGTSSGYFSSISVKYNAIAGISLSSNSTINIPNAVIDSNAGYGIYAVDGSAVFGDSVTIQNQTGNSYGLYAQSSNIRGQSWTIIKNSNYGVMLDGLTIANLGGATIANNTTGNTSPTANSGLDSKGNMLWQ